MDNEKRAFNAGASGKYTSYEDWKNKQVESTTKFEDILSVVDVWNEESVHRGNIPKAQKPKKGSPLARIIAKRIAESSLSECLQCVRNYAEVIASSYFFSYVWNIRTFFERPGAYAEFTSNGSKYLSYRTWRTNNPLKISQLNDREREMFGNLVERQLNAIIKAAAPSDADIKGIKGQIYPLVFCGAAKQKEINVDVECSNPHSGSSFYPKFENIVVVGSNNSEKVIHGYKEKYAKYIQRVWSASQQSVNQLKA